MQYTQEVRLKALLCYIWPIGLILFFVEKADAFVRFNAAQATVVLVGMVALSIFSIIPFFVFDIISWVYNVAALVLSVICAINCWNGSTFRIPVVADLADKLLAAL